MATSQSTDATVSDLQLRLRQAEERAILAEESVALLQKSLGDSVSAPGMFMSVDVVSLSTLCQFLQL